MTEKINLHYKFPLIKTIDDVLPSIKNHDEFKIFDKDEYIIIDYVYTQPDSFDCVIRRECRGITFNKNGELISRPLNKFFNLGEREETQPHVVDLSKPHEIFLKMDGSMIRPCLVNGELQFMTRKGVTDVANQIWDEIQLSDHSRQYMLNCLNDGLTPIYEYISPNNKIVVEYEKPELILLAVRENHTGLYLPTYGEGIICDLSFNNPKELLEHTKGQTGIEGYVVRFEDGHMIKIKTEEYLRLHRTIDVFESEKNIIHVILNDETDDLYSMLSDDKKDKLKRYEDALKTRIRIVSQTVRDFVKRYKNKSQKEFALYVLDIHPKFVQPLFFQFRKNTTNFKDYEIVKNFILNKATNSTRIEELRGIIPEKEWKDF